MLSTTKISKCRPAGRTLGILLAILFALYGNAPGAAGDSAKPEIRAEKEFVLDWLSQPEVVKEFGRISEAIWRFAELGLQEFKSSALLVKTPEKEGFHVDTGLAGMWNPGALRRRCLASGDAGLRSLGRRGRAGLREKVPARAGGTQVRPDPFQLRRCSPSISARALRECDDNTMTRPEALAAQIVNQTPPLDFPATMSFRSDAELSRVHPIQAQQRPEIQGQIVQDIFVG